MSIGSYPVGLEKAYAVVRVGGSIEGPHVRDYSILASSYKHPDTALAQAESEPSERSATSRAFL